MNNVILCLLKEESKTRLVFQTLAASYLSSQPIFLGEQPTRKRELKERCL